MRPLTLDFQAFGPYAGKEHIDFADLTGKGLLLICGATGSGKTMILDAMTLALYGKASGGMRNDFAAMRCNRCRPEDETFIEFVFEAGGSVYKFERRLTMKKVNLSESQNIYRMDEDGRFQPIREKINKSDMPAVAEELIGLNYDQFTQVIILPQGKFERFLESDSGQKGEILSEIFDTGRWADAANNYYRKAKADVDELQGLRDHVNSILGTEDCADLDALKQKIADTEKQLAELESEFKKADFDNRRSRLLADKEAAGRLRGLQKAAEDRQSDVKTAEEAAVRLESERETAENSLREHKSREGDKEALNREKAALEAKTDIYANLEKVQNAFDEAEKNLENARKAADNAEKALDKAQKKENGALKAYEEADREHKNVLHAFARGAAGRLAAELKEGEECPVCGSTHHPNPAKAGEDDVSSAEVDEKYEALGKKHDAWESARKSTEKARKDAETARDERTAAENARNAAENALSDSRSGMVDGIESLRQLKDRITKIDEETAAFDKRLAELTEAAENSRISLAEAGTAHRKAVEEAAKAAEELETARRTLIEEAGRTEEPDIAHIEAKLAGIDEETASFQREKGSMNTNIARMKNMHDTLTEDWEKYSSQISGAEDALAFARQLRGDTSVGLERYVLGIMFNQVIYAANEMLAKVHGGRYSLVKTEEALGSSRKKGLDLAVLDSYSESEVLRPASSLSGGEKFLVSLALSIGLSTIARTDGINIEAMFIDEGFGTLDEGSIGDALEVLEGIRGGSDSFVGIISHVQILRDSIPSKLVVNKDRSTSTIEYTMG